MKRIFLFWFVGALACSLSAQSDGEYCCSGKDDSIVTLKNILLPFASNPQPVTVGVRNGIAYYQGDIVLGRLSDLRRQSGAAESISIDGSNRRWPNARIPYTISADFPSAYKNTILQAIAYVSGKTNLCLKAKAEDDTDYVTFTPLENTCSSSIGKVGGQQYIWLSSSGCDVGRIVHEICHAAGLYHEQAREDRDTFVTIHWDNIQPDKKHNFNQEVAGATDIGAYDYYAIMHYEQNAFTIDPTKNTITPKKALPAQHKIVAIVPPLPSNIGIGQRYGMTEGEIAAINSLYPTACNDCSAPTWVDNNGGTTFFWENTGAVGYMFEIREKGTADWTVRTVSTNSIYHSVSVPGAITYEVRVKSICDAAGNTSDYSKIYEFYYIKSNCPRPSWVTFSNVTGNSAEVTWATVWGVNKYFFYHKKLSDNAWIKNVVSTPQFQLSGLAPATTYNVAVSAVCVENGVEQESYALFEHLTTTALCVAPSDPTANNIQPTAATVSWSATTGVNAYKLEYKRAVDVTWTVLNNLTGNSKVLTNLQPSTLYHMRLSMVCAGNANSPLSNIVTFTTAVCGTPTLPTISAVQATSATLNWVAISGITTYKIEYKRTFDATWINLGNSTGTSKVIANLEPNTGYQARVSAVCSSSSTSIPSNAIGFTTGQCAPPSSIGVNNVQAAAATITWAMAPGVNTVRLEYKRTVDATWASAGNITGTSRVLTNLASSTTYQVRVSSVCSSNSTSTPSTLVSFTTGTCSAPSGLYISGVQTSQATVNWVSVTGVANYKVEYKRTVDAAWINLGNNSGTSRSLTNLQFGTNYQVRVSSVCSNSSTSNASNLLTFSTAACAAPGAPTISNILPTQVTATWAIVAGVTTYKVELKRNVDAIWSDLGNTTSTSHNLINLVPGTLYQLRVSSVCSSSANSTPSAVSNFSTPTCAPPSSLSPNNIQPTSVLLSWPAVAGISSFKLEWKRSVDASWSTVTVTGTSRTLTGLLSGTVYQARVSSICSNSMNSNPSSTIVFTTSIAPLYDDPCNGLVFIPGSNCAQQLMTNIGASATTVPIAPNACGSNNLKDVWFRAQAPSTGKINITTFPGTMTNGVIGLYFGNSCGALSYYSCWDANGADEMPDIWAATSPGSWIYLRYWGFGGQTGTFYVCVDVAPALNQPEFGQGDEPRAGLLVPEGVEERQGWVVPTSTLQAYPNPAYETLTLQGYSPFEADETLVLSDLSGKEVLRRPIHLPENATFEQAIDLGGLPTGMYWARLRLGTQLTAVKVAILH